MKAGGAGVSTGTLEKGGTGISAATSSLAAADRVYQWTTAVGNSQQL